MNNNTYSFRERFKRWKNGERYWSIVGRPLPHYTTGKDSTDIRLPEFKKGKTQNKFNSFVEKIGPSLYKALLENNIQNLDVAYYNMMRQLAYESNYGQSRIAQAFNNFGGVGYNGKTYSKFKDVDDFMNNYVGIYKGRHKEALSAKNPTEFAKALKKSGYYQDSFENYSRNLNGMVSVANAARAHRQSNPNLYILPKQPVLEQYKQDINTIPADAINQNYDVMRSTQNRILKDQFGPKPPSLRTEDLLYELNIPEPGEYVFPQYNTAPQTSFNNGKDYGQFALSNMLAMNQMMNKRILNYI